MTHVTRRIGVALGGVTAMLLAVGLAGCAGEPEDPNLITVWTTDTLPDRFAATQAIVDSFTRETGVRVELVGVEEDQFIQVLTSSAAAGDLPDVMGNLPLASVRTLGANDLVDVAATAAIVDALGADTFDGRALELTADGAAQLAVPSEAWSQVLFYRRDLFAAAGLPAPSTYADIRTAAQTLDSGAVAGFVGATAAGDAFTQQTFEHLALANGCELVDPAGEIIIDSPPCVAAFEFYRDLISSYSVPGAQDVDTVRASYFAGQAAMIVWSTFLLDELAGLRDDALPTCPECSDPAFLSANTGIVAALQGPDGAAPAQFGEVTSWTVPVDANTGPARRFVEYVMGPGYLDWLAIAPEGRLPVRSGTTPGGTENVDAWGELPVGVDRKAPLAQFYPPEVLDALAAGPEDFTRWGITQGQGDLVGASLGELPVPAAVAALTGGATDAQGAAEQAAAELQEIQDSLR